VNERGTLGPVQYSEVASV